MMITMNHQNTSMESLKHSKRKRLEQMLGWELHSWTPSSILKFAMAIGLKLLLVLWGIPYTIWGEYYRSNDSGTLASFQVNLQPFSQDYDQV